MPLPLSMLCPYVLSGFKKQAQRFMLLQTLSTLSKSRKTVPTSVEFVDIAGLVKGASEGQGLGNKFLANIRECDSIVQVGCLLGRRCLSAHGSNYSVQAASDRREGQVSFSWSSVPNNATCLGH